MSLIRGSTITTTTLRPLKRLDLKLSRGEYVGKPCEGVGARAVYEAFGAGQISPAAPTGQSGCEKPRHAPGGWRFPCWRVPQALRLQLGNLHVSQLHSDAPEPSTCRSYHTARSARSGTSSRSERSKHSLKKERKERKGKRSEDGRLDVARSSGASERRGVCAHDCLGC